MEGNEKKTRDVEITADITFSDMMLSDRVLAGLTKCNFSKPSPIQLRAIPIGRCGSDMIIKSKSGTGKTLVFCTIILEKYDPCIKSPQSLIVVPTREIALQVENCLNSLGFRCPGFNATSVIGGRDVSDDRRRLSKCKAIVGTPGRLLHLIHSNFICMQHIQLLVFDEADKLFHEDFRKDIHVILKALNRNRQIIASSATYADGLDKLIVSFMQNPVAVSATREIPMLIGVKQFVFSVEGFPLSSAGQSSTPAIQTMLRKVKGVEKILGSLTFKQCVLFSNSQLRASSFASYLTANGWSVDLILGSHEQPLRMSTLQKFRQYESRILIASDLLARGVDVENINLVINLDVPTESSTYLHRIGRCGRFGTRGIAITLLSDHSDANKFGKLLNHIGDPSAKIPKLTSKLLNGDCDLWSTKANDISAFEYITTGQNSLDENGVTKCDTDDSEFLDLLNVAPCKTNGVHSSPPEEKKCVEDENLQLLEIAQRLVNSDSNQSMKIEEDLFSSFQNSSNGTFPVNTNECNGNARPESGIEKRNENSIDGSEEAKSSEEEELENSSFESGYNISADSEMESSDGQPVKSDNIEQLISDIESIRFEEDGNHGELPDLKWEPVIKPTLLSNYKRKKRNEARARNIDSVSSNQPYNIWRRIFWQQLNQITQYVSHSSLH